MTKPKSVAFYAVAAHIVAGKGADARYLLLRRSGPYLRGNWQMVVGRIDKKETAWRAALREIREETGLSPDSLYNSGEVEVFYEQRADRVAVVPTFVAFVDGTCDATLSPDEHDACEWVDFETAMDRLDFPQQRRVLEAVHRNFVLNEPSEHLRITTV